MNLINHENPNHGSKLISHNLSHIISWGKTSHKMLQSSGPLRRRTKQTWRYGQKIGLLSFLKPSAVYACLSVRNQESKKQRKNKSVQSKKALRSMILQSGYGSLNFLSHSYIHKHFHTQACIYSKALSLSHAQMAQTLVLGKWLLIEFSLSERGPHIMLPDTNRNTQTIPNINFCTGTSHVYSNMQPFLYGHNWNIFFWGWQ